jgi:uncharacterized membrane protein YfcA
MLAVDDTLMLITGGFVAGIVNTMAGGGSLLTVPLLVMLGLPGTVANATNRVGVFVQSLVGAWRFRAEGVPGFKAALPVMLPLLLGSALGAVAVSRLADETFERLFGVAMLVVLVPALRSPKTPAAQANSRSSLTTFLVFTVIGVYGGAFQAGVGILLVLALAGAGNDLVLSNSIKSVVVTAFTLVALIVFVVQGQVAWVPALILSASTAAGAAVGARITVAGGERIVRPVLAIAVVVLAGRMLGLY